MKLSGLWRRMRRRKPKATAGALDSADPLLIAPELAANAAALREIFRDCTDAVFRPVYFGQNGSGQGLLVYLEVLTDARILSDAVLTPLMLADPVFPAGPTAAALKRVIPVAEVNEETTLAPVVQSILSGAAALFVEGLPAALAIKAQSWKKRGVEKIEDERVILGPKEGFNETLRDNIALIRQRLRTSDLKAERFVIGERTKTEVVVMYLASLAREEVVRGIKEKLAAIRAGGVVSRGIIAEMLEGNVLSPFPQITETERPDSIVGNLLEGRVAILIDGVPVVMLLPVMLAQLFQSPDDYYNRPFQVTVIRFIRVLGFIISTTFPALYVAILTFHHEMIPADMLVPLARSRAGLPFSPLTETLLMDIAVELLREASLRLPGPVGQTIGIVGALILGDSAVRANIVSPVLVIVLAISMLGSFTIPNYSASLGMRLLRFPITIMAGFLSGYGISFTWAVILIHLCSLESFGTPYLVPVAPLRPRDLKDFIVRAPWFLLGERPSFMRAGDREALQVQEERNEDNTGK